MAGNGASGTYIQMLVILGSVQGAVLAVTAAIGPQFGSNAHGFAETGWRSVLPPSVHPVSPSRVVALPQAEAFKGQAAQ